jgi:hypothetical protein
MPDAGETAMDSFFYFPVESLLIRAVSVGSVSVSVDFLGI